MPQNPLVTILGPSDGHEENFLKIQKPTQQMSGGWVYAMQKTRIILRCFATEIIQDYGTQ
jgi:hypothetical protein